MNITELAKQAGFEHNTLGWTYTSGRLDDNLKKFAALVSAQALEEAAKVCDGVLGNNNVSDAIRSLKEVQS